MHIYESDLLQMFSLNTNDMQNNHQTPCFLKHV